MLRLMLLRHAKTERLRRHQHDRERILTKRGRADAGNVARYMVSYCLVPDQVVVSRGEAGRHFYVIAAGRAVVELDDGVTRELQPGEFFGDIALLRDVPRTATVRAVEDVEVAVVPGPRLEALLDALPQLQRNLLATLSARLARVTRLALHEQPGKLVIVEDADGEDLLGYALAASIAWHTRSRAQPGALSRRAPFRSFARTGRTGSCRTRTRQLARARDRAFARSAGSARRAYRRASVDRARSIRPRVSLGPHGHRSERPAHRSAPTGWSARCGSRARASFSDEISAQPGCHTGRTASRSDRFGVLERKRSIP